MMTIVNPAAPRRLQAAMSTALLLIALWTPPSAGAVDLELTVVFDISSQPLASALIEFSKQADVQIMSAGIDLTGRQAPALSGRYSIGQALKLLLNGTGLVYGSTGPNTIAVSGPSALAHNFSSSGPNANAHKALHTIAPTALPMAGAGQSAHRPDTNTSGQSQEDQKATQGLQSNYQNIKMEEVVVTGTRIRRTGQGSSPFIQLGRDDMLRLGESTVGRALRKLPQNFAAQSEFRDADPVFGSNPGGGTGVNLRGLGVDSTLVLINGRRVVKGGLAGSFVDVSFIPSAVVDRIDVLTDGASAVYGADAVGGVVNFILRRKFSGIEANVRSDVATRGGYGEGRVALTGGHAWATGNALVSGEYRRQGDLLLSERGFARDPDKTGRGGSVYSSRLSYPGNLRAADGFLDALNIATPAGGTSIALPELDRGEQLDVNGLSSGIDRVNTSFPFKGAMLIPNQRSWTIFSAVNQDIRSNLHFTLDAFAGQRRTITELPEQAAVLSIPASNAVNPFGETIIVEYAHHREAQRSRTNLYSANAGIVLDLDAWKIDAMATYGRDESISSTPFARFAGPSLTEAFASNDPALAFNPFLGSADQSEAAREAVYVRNTIGGSSVLKAADLFVEGPLFRISGEDVRLVVGVSNREESFYLDQIINTIGNPQFVNRRGNRETTAAFAEVLTPLIEEDAESWVQSLSVDAAIRWEDASGAGESTTPKFGIRAKLTDSILLRSTWGKSFRAPPLLSVFNPVRVIPVVNLIADPLRPGELVSADLISGGNLSLRPERAETFTLGGVFQPPALHDLTLSVAYFDTSYKDRIESPHFVTVLLNEQLYPGLVLRGVGLPSDPPGIPGPVRQIDLRSVNLSTLEVAGVDFGLEYRTPAFGGTLQGNANITWTSKFETRLTENSPPSDQVATVGRPPAWRGVLSLGWLGRDMSASISANVVDSYKSAVGPSGVRVDSSWIIDSSITYTLRGDDGKGLTLSAGIANLLDEDPSFLDLPEGYDANIGDPRGRTIYLELGYAL